MTSTPDTLALGAAALSVTVAVSGFFLKRWIDKVDQKLDALSASLGDLKVQSATAVERYSQILGLMGGLQGQTSSLTKDVGRHSASVEKLWTILEAKGVLPSRPSDMILRAGGDK